MQKTYKDIALLLFKSKVEFKKWLSKNWEQTESVWLMLAKKTSSQKSLSYEEARELAISYGWIDGLINKWDDNFYLIRFSKRRKQSTWSKINRDIAEALIKNKNMHQNGIEEVQRAKKDGRWDLAYDSPKNMTVPSWFIKELKQHKDAYEFYLTLNKANRYSIAYHLRTPKKEETKKRWAEKYIKMLKNKKKIY